MAARKIDSLSPYEKAMDQALRTTAKAPMPAKTQAPWPATLHHGPVPEPIVFSSHLLQGPTRKNPRQPHGRPPAPEQKCPPPYQGIPRGQGCFYEQSPNFKKKCLGGATRVIKTRAKGRLIYTCEICGEWQVRDEVAEWAPDDYDVGE